MSRRSGPGELAACAGTHFDPPSGACLSRRIHWSVASRRRTIGLARLTSIHRQLPSLGRSAQRSDEWRRLSLTVAGVVAIGTLQTLGQAAAVQQATPMAHAGSGQQQEGSGTPSGTSAGGGSNSSSSRHGSGSGSAHLSGSTHSSGKSSGPGSDGPWYRRRRIEGL